MSLRLADLIPSLLLKKAAPYICVPLSNYLPSQCHLGSYHRIGSLQMLPLYLKKVIDVFLVTTDLRISFTSVLVKVMERIIHCQIGSALSSSCQLSNFQHGFRPHHSTIFLLLTVIHNWVLCLDCRSTGLFTAFFSTML